MECGQLFSFRPPPNTICLGTVEPSNVLTFDLAYSYTVIEYCEAYPGFKGSRLTSVQPVSLKIHEFHMDAARGSSPLSTESIPQLVTMSVYRETCA